MPDPYLAIADIAGDLYMTERMNAAATQQSYLGNVHTDPQDAVAWVSLNRYIWASSPSWGEKWRYATDSHVGEDPPYEPGKDEAVITDDDILSAVQQLVDAPGRQQAAAEAPEDQREADQAAQVVEENAAASDA
jgi:hypothetical protein